MESVKNKTFTKAGDKIFRSLSTGSGVLILLTLATVSGFLIWQSIPAITGNPEAANGDLGGYLLPLVFGTIYSSLLALLIAVPLSIGIGLFISHYAPRALAQTLGYVIDLLAAIPSVVYGLWGIMVLAPAVQPIYEWLTINASWFPLFEGPVSGTGRTILTVSIVLAIMILPIMSAIAREIFLQTPKLQQEAALALGATRWEMIRLSVLPYAKSGLISAGMLGLGRALGETMAVALVLSPANVISFNLLTSTNPTTIAANIALNFPEASGLNVNLLIASGLVLFAITMVVNIVARRIASGGKK
jgi:phosphate transport system permease protein